MKLRIATTPIRITSYLQPYFLTEYTNGCARSTWLGPVLLTVEKQVSWQSHFIWKWIGVNWMPE